MAYRHLRDLLGLGLFVAVALATACGGKHLDGGGAGSQGGVAGLGGIAGAAGGAGGMPDGGALGGSGVTGSGGGAAGALGAGGAAGALGAGGAAGAAACVETVTPLRTSGTILELTIDPVLGGQPFVYGEPNLSPTGGTITPINFRFYVSEVRLLAAGGGVVPVDIVTAAGSPQPYGVHFFNYEDASSRALRVLAPPGTYTGIDFALGLSGPCNTSTFEARNPPLSSTSQMTWPPPFGYLFLRYEALLTTGAQAADAGAGPPRAIHMGGFPKVLAAPAIRVDGSLSVPAGGAVTRSLQVVMDQIFLGANTPVDLTGVPLAPGEEVTAGERLRQNAPGLQLFTLGP